jgi:hypothetical protein
MSQVNITPSSSRVGMSQKSARNSWMKEATASVTSDYLPGKVNGPKRKQWEGNMYSIVARMGQDGGV